MKILVLCFYLLYVYSLLGLTDMEEGELEGQQLKLSTTSLGRMSFGSPPAVKQVFSSVFGYNFS